MCSQCKPGHEKSSPGGPPVRAAWPRRGPALRLRWSVPERSILLVTDTTCPYCRQTVSLAPDQTACPHCLKDLSAPLASDTSQYDPHATQPPLVDPYATTAEYIAPPPVTDPERPDF